MKSELKEAMQRLGLSERVVEPLWLYLRLLASWNEAFNLTAIPPERWIKWHIMDSLSLIPFLQPQLMSVGRRSADLGSGAGLPGIPLAIVLRNFHWTLIEKNGKRASFLLRVKNELLLSNVEIIHSRAEELDLTPNQLFSYVTVRAVGRCAFLCRLALPLLAQGGRLLAMKGKLAQAELDEVTEPWRLIGVNKIVLDDPPEKMRNLSVVVWEKG